MGGVAAGVEVPDPATGEAGVTLEGPPGAGVRTGGTGAGSEATGVAGVLVSVPVSAEATGTTTASSVIYPAPNPKGIQAVGRSSTDSPASA